MDLALSQCYDCRGLDFWMHRLQVLQCAMNVGEWLALKTHWQQSIYNSRVCDGGIHGAYSWLWRDIDYDPVMCHRGIKDRYPAPRKLSVVTEQLEEEDEDEEEQQGELLLLRDRGEQEEEEEDVYPIVQDLNALSIIEEEDEHEEEKEVPKWVTTPTTVFHKDARCTAYGTPDMYDAFPLFSAFAAAASVYDQNSNLDNTPSCDLEQRCDTIAGIIQVACAATDLNKLVNIAREKGMTLACAFAIAAGHTINNKTRKRIVNDITTARNNMDDDDDECGDEQLCRNNKLMRACERYVSALLHRLHKHKESVLTTILRASAHHVNPNELLRVFSGRYDDEDEEQQKLMSKTE